MERQVIGILAHVDAGKTTLSEGILYKSGVLRKLGRVDKKDAFLDNYTLERERGITIYSKQAIFEHGGVSFTLIDTPGHVDFSTEMERALLCLDMAILVISGPDGVQAHTRTLWKLLSVYDIPTFVFINKMDREGADADSILTELRGSLSKDCIRFDRELPLEDIALCDEELMEKYLETGELEDSDISDLIVQRKIFPCFFGSALKCEGIDELLDGIAGYTPKRYDQGGFAGRVYKITRDKDGSRLTHVKITSGSLKVRDNLTYSAKCEDTGNKPLNDDGSGDDQADDCVNELTEKITALRAYNGERFDSITEAYAGMVVAVAGLSATYPGQALGEEEELLEPEIVPVMTYKVAGANTIPGHTDIAIQPKDVLPLLKACEEEDPSLHVIWNSELRELQVNIMGDIQLEILKSRLFEKYGKNVLFDKGSILYRETIKEPVIGVGHFEPLRHYAEVQLLMEPGAPGSGITFSSAVSVNDLEINWQRLIQTHIFEREHKGVLTGAVLTDVHFTLVAGRSHIKHTEGGDFRQATYRAVRQGLMKAESVLLEPYYEFSIELPSQFAGRAMTDIDRRYGKLTGREDKVTVKGNITEGEVILTGIAPAATMQGYQKELTSYSKGLGSIYSTFCGYLPAHNSEEVIKQKNYDPLSDLRNPASSVFCAHGAGFVVEWYDVDNYKHLEAGTNKVIGEDDALIAGEERVREAKRTAELGSVMAVLDRAMGYSEVDAIINQSVGANRKSSVRKNPYRKHHEEALLRKAAAGSAEAGTSYSAMRAGGIQKKKTSASYSEQKEKYLLVDGYNIIFAWEKLRDLAKTNVDSARDTLNDILSEYAGMHALKLIVVYDAYRVSGHRTEQFRFHNINVIYTAEAETADKFIERFAHENAKQYNVTVATSDGLEQIIIRGAGCNLMTANDLLSAVTEQKKDVNERFLKVQPKASTSLEDVIKKAVDTHN